MRDVPENELFSAYLDGELTAAEQAEVERLLASSAAARQLLEGLKALSATLQSLPVHKLDEDLSERVLRVAERQMLTGPVPRPRPNDAFQAVAAAPVGRALWRRLARPRTLFWPAAAAAIAVLIMVLDRGADRRPAAEKVALAPPAAAEKAPAGPPTLRAAPEESGRPVETAPESGALAERTANGRWDVAARRSAAEKEAMPALAAERPSVAPAEGKIATTEGKADRTGGDKASSRLASSTPPADRPAAQPAPMPSAPAREHLAETPAAPAAPPALKTPAPYGAKLKGQPEAKPAADSIAKSAPAKEDTFGAGMGGAGAGAAGQPMKADPAAIAKTPSQPLYSSGVFAVGKVAAVPVLVVRCEVSAEAAARGILHQVFARDQSLSLEEKKAASRGKEGPRGGVAGFGAMDDFRQQVQVVEDGQARQETQMPVARKLAQQAQADAAIPAEPAAVMPQKPAAVLQREPQSTVSGTLRRAEKSGAEVYLDFDATPGQVQAALAELKARPDVFSFLAVDSGQESLKADQKRAFFEEADRDEVRRRVRFVLRVAPSRAPVAADVALEKAAEKAEKAAKTPADRFEAKPPAAAAGARPAAAAPAGAPPPAK